MIESVHIKHYKAIQDSKKLPVPPFAVFIGNNGSGKSSVFEALQLLHEAMLFNLNTAFSRCGGLENVRHSQAVYADPKKTVSGYLKDYAGIEVKLTCRIKGETYKYEVVFNTSRNLNFYLIEYESLKVNKTEIFSAHLHSSEKHTEVEFKLNREGSALKGTYPPNKLFISGVTLNPPDECLIFREYVSKWQFLALNAQSMGFPVTQNRMTSDIQLQPDGRNLAEFIQHLASEPDRLNSLIEKMKFVLPYASDVQTLTTEDFERKVQLRLLEVGQKKSIPGWLFSSGTLRILAILAVLEGPNPPTALFIDEVENGLDPRTIGLLINEFQQQYASRQTQIIVTTHSPYFLDLVPLKSIIVSEKTHEGNFFHLPKDEKSLAVWRDKFSPGKLYTMGRLTK